MSKPRTLIGFDYGMKHIGVAVGQEITKTANPLKTIKARGGIPNWHDIKNLLTKWQPQLLIVGLPLNMDGSEQKMTVAARKFGRRLNDQFGIAVEWQDERLTTYESLAQSAIHSKLQAKTDGDIDCISAKLILQSWLNQRKL